jgi:arsenate reductase-like glutaredoxin family protein
MKAREFLAQKKQPFTERDLMKQPLSEAEAQALGKRLGGIRELVAPKRRAEAEKVPDAKLAGWLAANPNFVRRPLIDTGKGLEAGFTAQTRERLG